MAVDLRTTYLGLELRNPLVPSASPLSGSIDTLRALEAAGAGAIVMKSLFEEQIRHETLEMMRLLELGTESFAEAQSYLPTMEDYNTGPHAYLEHLEAAKRTLRIPVIGSLNVSERGSWVRYAGLIEDTGADALELNIYFVPTDPAMDSAIVERRYVDTVAAVREAVRLPIAVKVGPYFSSIPSMVKRLVAAGADGVVLFNRFVHPDIDLDTLEVVPDMRLSTRLELRAVLRWLAILRGRTGASLAATTGIHQVEDVVKCLLVGADVTMMASALLERGPGWLGAVLRGLEAWLADRGYESVDEIKGSLCQHSCPDPSVFERTQYMKALINYTADYATPKAPA